MDCTVVETSPAGLAAYAEIPIRFEVRSIFEIQGNDPASAILEEKPINPFWIKDYDAIQGEGPLSWPARWDISKWSFLVASAGTRRLGGCAIAYQTRGIDKLEGRDDLALVWDLRVAPEYRGRQVGRRLFETAVRWARDHECTEVKVETQNINVPACQFYARQGCRLASINRFAYPTLPEEVELMWALRL